MGLTTFRQNRTKALKTIFQSDNFNVDNLGLATSTGGVFLAAPVADEIFELFANAEMLLNTNDIVSEFFKKYTTFWSLNRERFERLDDLINVTLDPSNNVDITTVTNHGHTISETTGGADTKTLSGTDTRALSGTDTTTDSGSDIVTEGGKDKTTVQNSTTDTQSGTDTTTNGERTEERYRATFDSETPVPTDTTVNAENDISVAYGKVDTIAGNGTNELEYGHTETTAHGKIETVQHGKTETTNHGKKETTVHGMTDNTTHGGTDTVHEYGTRGNFDVSELLKNAIDIEKALYDLRVLFVTEFVRAYCI